MSKHTPGPWKVVIENDDSDWAIVTGKGGNIVANVNSETGPDLPPLVSTKMPQRANARLIAAAPELLEACKDLLAFMEQYDLLDWDLADDDRARIDAARAAIAKATGEQ